MAAKHNPPLYQDLPGLDVGAMEDAEQVVGHLCERFSGLIDRVAQAEDSVNEERKRCAEAEAELAKLAEQRHPSRQAVHHTIATVREDIRSQRLQLAEARAQAERRRAELHREREALAAIEGRYQELTSTLEAEKNRTMGVHETADDENKAFSEYREKQAHLKDRIHVISLEFGTLAEDLAHVRERSLQQRSRIKECESKCNELVQARETTDGRAVSQHDELCSAVRKVALLKERLAAAQAQVVHREQELQGQEQMLNELRNDNQKREGEVVAATKHLKRLHMIDAQREQSVWENAEMRSELEADKSRRRHAREQGSVAEAEHVQETTRLQRTANDLVATESEVVQIRSRVKVLGERNRQQAERAEELQKESVRLTGVHKELLKQSQTAFSDNDSIRRTRDELATETESLRRRVKMMAPSLESARRRWRELEEHAEVLQLESRREHKTREDVQREVARLQKQLHGSRRKNMRLMEQVQDSEEHVLRCFSLAVARQDAPHSARSALADGRHDLPSARSTLQDGSQSCLAMGHGEVARSSSVPKAHLAAAAEGQSGGGTHQDANWTPSKSLGYLKTWIEIEEARLGVHPPSPLALPGANTPPLPLLSGSQDASENAEIPLPRMPEALATFAPAAAPDAVGRVLRDVGASPEDVAWGAVPRQLTQSPKRGGSSTPAHASPRKVSSNGSCVFTSIATP